MLPLSMSNGTGSTPNAAEYNPAGSMVLGSASETTELLMCILVWRGWQAMLLLSM
jgi:hypothetical protein